MWLFWPFRFRMLRKLGPPIAAGFRGIEELSAIIAAMIIMGLMFLMVADVLGRKMFNAPLSGTTEIAEITLVGVVYLSISYVQRLHGHVNVDLFVKLLPSVLRLGLDVFALVLAFLISAVITWRSALFAWESILLQDYTMGIARVPAWPGKAVVTFGFGLLSLRLLPDIFRAWCLLREASLAKTRQTSDGTP